MAHPKADLVAILTKTKNDFEKSVKQTRKELRKISRALESGKTTFCVTVLSYWADSDEKHVKTTRQGTIEEVFAYADEEFTRVNNRNDDQRGHKVYLASGKVLIEIPDEVCRKYLKGYKPFK